MEMLMVVVVEWFCCVDLFVVGGKALDVAPALDGANSEAASIRKHTHTTRLVAQTTLDPSILFTWSLQVVHAHVSAGTACHQHRRAALSANHVHAVQSLRQVHVQSRGLLSQVPITQLFVPAPSDQQVHVRDPMTRFHRRVVHTHLSRLLRSQVEHHGFVITRTGKRFSTIPIKRRV